MAKATLLTFLFILTSIYLSYGRTLDQVNPFKFSTPKMQAERLIRGLNLFPKADINMGPNMKQLSPLMVEHPLNFPMVEGDNGSSPSVQDLGHHAGYYKLPHTKDARMFYYFFESRNNRITDPVVIWLTGGPGCSSQFALFYENGPFHITNNLSLAWNDYGWDQASNIIYVDQPTGTGFSYSSDPDDIRHDEDGISKDLYDFLQEFFKNHPQYVKNDFFITGESYAGHYIPAFASRVLSGNNNQTGIHINLKGFAIGNGLTNPAIQYAAFPDFSKDMKLINQSVSDSIKKDMLPPCEEQIKLCGINGGQVCTSAFNTCNEILDMILEISGVNYYDIRKKCEEAGPCYDFSNLETFLNQDSVKEALGVGDINFVSCSSTVYEAMIRDWMKNLEVGIPAMLEDGILFLAYAGEYDLICNWLGNSKWAHDMEWSGKIKFSEAPNVTYVVDGTEAGLMQSYGPLTFLKVHDAGHFVPMDQPKAALEMLKRWTRGDLSVTSTRDELAPSTI